MNTLRKSTKPLSPLVFALAVMLTGLPRAVQSISISFSTVVDMATAIPDGAGNFTGFTPPDPIIPLGPAISDQGNVAFAGFGADGQVGILPPTRRSEP